MQDAKQKDSPDHFQQRLCLFLLSLSLVAITLTCGKKAPPLPPVPIVPLPPQEAKVMQSGDSLLFSFRLPVINTDNKTPAEIGKIVIYRLKAPRSAQTPQPETQPQTMPAQTQTATPPAESTQTQSQPQTQTAPQTQTVESLTQTQTHQDPQTQTTQTQTAPQTQSQPLIAEIPRALTAFEFEEQAEEIAEVPPDQVDSYMRGEYFIFQDKPDLGAESQDLQNWFYYGAKIYNKKGKENEFGRLPALFPVIVPETPTNFFATVSEKKITMQWNPVTKDIRGNSLPEGSVVYTVYRGNNANFAPLLPLNPAILTTPAFEDTIFEFGNPYYYFVRASVITHRRDQESAPSNVLLIYPQDIYPPSAPQELNVVAAREGMVLIWAPNPEEDVVGYNVFKKMEGESEFKKHNTELIRETTYTDPDAKPGVRYYYQVSAVDAASTANESERSNEVSEVTRNQ